MDGWTTDAGVEFATDQTRSVDHHVALAEESRGVPPYCQEPEGSCLLPRALPWGRSLLCGPDGAGSKCPAWQNRNTCGKYLPGLAWSWLCAAVTRPADSCWPARLSTGKCPVSKGPTVADQVRDNPRRKGGENPAQPGADVRTWEPSGRDRNLVGAGVGESDGEPYHLVAGAMPRNKGGNYRRFAHELLHLGTPMDQ